MDVTWTWLPRKGNIVPGDGLAPPAAGKSGAEPASTANSLSSSHETTCCGSHYGLSFLANDRPTYPISASIITE